MSVLYSTGPVENVNGDGSLDPSFTLDKLFHTVVVNILNNSEKKKNKFEIAVFDIDGPKNKAESFEGSVEEEFGFSLEIEVSEFNRFEIQIELSLKDDVHLSVTGKNALGEIIRELPLTRINHNKLLYSSCLSKLT
ncbi:hypothetical protein M3699_19600 [Peribacillus simplex]|uniref:hypothetical protein n=1 Tax=Peribacillus simplex TaxID=1478 RepID=UPI00203CA30F|nr:hypothetical protein [Peribacillus simplex]MCM3676004.1 hypothetical protein [Peribacillus simplex]